ncbi:hypothetical protein DFH09DRAFT_1037923 [Mycena vulgaris]|nr:hypothetical protein DFH09DRAFT_1037923 [Mycena vulgaris]
MAELIGVLTSILQLIDVVAEAGTLIKDLHNAPKEQRRLFAELQALRPLVVALQDRIRGNRSLAGIQKMEPPLRKLEDTMKHCTKKLKAGNGLFTRVSKPLAWTLWNKQEAKQDLDKIERFKSLLNIWLTMDIWDVSQKQSKSHEDILIAVQAFGQHPQVNLETEDSQHDTNQDWKSRLVKIGWSHAGSGTMVLVCVISVLMFYFLKTDDVLTTVKTVGAEQKAGHTDILVSVEHVAQMQQQNSDAAIRDRIIEWMSPINFFQRQADIFSMWQPGTGDWLLSDPQFKVWEFSSGIILWCRGMPGAGKTVLASLVVNYLGNKSQDQNIGVASVYLNHKETELQTPQNVLTGLWRQLVFGKSIPAAVHALYKDHHEKNTRPPLDIVHAVLTSSIGEYRKVYFVIDALDEYPEKQRNVLLTHLAMLGPTVNLMITSRPHVTLEPFLERVQHLEIQATEDDLSQYVTQYISKSHRLSRHVQTHPELYKEIESTILSNAQGMFLLAKLHMDSLSTKHTIKTVREELKNLPKDLKNTYDEAMQRIDHQSEEDRQLAQLTLIWVAYAKRPLLVGELQEALATGPEDTALDPDNLLDMDIVLSVCAGLVVVDETASTVRLIHYTAQDYLDTFQTHQFLNARTEIVSRCLAYFAFEKFLNLPPGSYTNIEFEWDVTGASFQKSVEASNQPLLKRHPLLRYSQYWILHIRKDLLWQYCSIAPKFGRIGPNICH